VDTPKNEQGGRNSAATMKRILLLAISLFPLAAGGAIPAQNSSVTWSKDGTRVLVMLSPYPGSDANAVVGFPDGRLVNLHDNFCSSGVYDVLTFETIWLVNWYSLKYELLSSDDLRYVARLNQSGFGARWAIAFYEEGNLTKEYTGAELLTGMKHWIFLPARSGAHTWWCEKLELNAEHNQLMLETARRRIYIAGHEVDLGLREFYTFDLATGSIVSRRTAGAWLIWVYGFAVVALVMTLFLLARWGWRKIRSLKRYRGFLVVPVVLDTARERAG
jgi:hypothetical protein